MALRSTSRLIPVLLTCALAMIGCGGGDSVTADTAPAAGPTFAPQTTELPARIRQGSTTTAGFSLAFGAPTTTAAPPTTAPPATTTVEDEPSTAPSTAPPAAPPVGQKPTTTTTTAAPATTTSTTTTAAPATTTTTTTKEPEKPAWCSSADKLKNAHPLDTTSTVEVASLRVSGPNKGDWTALNTFIDALRLDNGSVPDAATIASGDKLDAASVAQCDGAFMDDWFTAYGGWPANS